MFAGLRRTCAVVVRRRALSLPAHKVVGLPALSPTMEGGTIAAWKVQEGGSFSAGDVVAEIETDKATVDFEAQDDGIIAKIFVEAGSETKVGDPIMVVVEEWEDVAAFKDFPVPAAAGGPVAAPTEAVAPAAPPPAPLPSSAAVVPIAAPEGGRLVASPFARKLAKERGIDLALVAGSGPGGRVIAEDVERFVPPAVVTSPREDVGVAPSASSPPPPTVVPGGRDFALTPQSAAIAARLAYSMQTAPHYYLTIELDVGPALELLKTLNAGLDDDDGTIGVTDLFIKASAAATKAVPSVNSSWLDGGKVRHYERFDVNFVVGVHEGLAAPVLVDVDRLGLKDIADQTKQALRDASDPDATPAPYASGTFTLCNLGAFGVSSAAPVVHSPQACALALGTIEDKLVPAAKGDQPYALQPTLVATLSADHRVVDGAVGAQWLQALKGLIEKPHTLLL